MGTVLYMEADGSNEQVVEYDDTLSFKDFTGRVLTDETLYNFNGKTIYATCFSQETPGAIVFPDGMKGVTFVKCNLDNVTLPVDSIIIGCSQRQFEVQNDLNDWLVDENKNPVIPVDHEVYTKFNLPIPKPEDIPSQKVTERVDLKKEAETKAAEIAEVGVNP